jgi:hypothetical protein
MLHWLEIWLSLPVVFTAVCRGQRELSAGSAQLAVEREAVRRERESLERRAEALQQVGAKQGLGRVVPGSTAAELLLRAKQY